MDCKPTFDSTNGVVRLIREEPPAHCIFKVELFSKSSKDQFDSPEFKAGGYTWVLSVYPKGYKQTGGDGHLSLYVSMVDKLSSRSFVYVMLRFFIYDQIRENFLTFLNVRDKLIHADVKSASGIPKLLPLGVFTSASNGYLVNDCCVFGVEVSVVKAMDGSNNYPCAFTPDGLNRNISAVKSEPKCAGPLSYTWRIENFSHLNNPTYSPVFCLGAWSWKLSIYPQGTDTVFGKFFSVFLHLDNSSNLSPSTTLYTQFELCLKNQGGQENRKRITSRNFPREATERWGFQSFLPMLDLSNKGFLVNDALIIELEIQELLVE